MARVVGVIAGIIVSALVINGFVSVIRHGLDGSWGGLAVAAVGLAVLLGAFVTADRRGSEPR